jgi:hypothetical protein
MNWFLTIFYYIKGVTLWKNNYRDRKAR